MLNLSNKARARARDRRIKRWSRPIDKRRNRVRAWIDLIFNDHGFTRSIIRNRHQFAPGAWRSSQPGPGDIAWAARKGIRTIINLRGGRTLGGVALEREACEQHGLAYVEMPMSSRGAPARMYIESADAVYSSAEHPILIHCKAGADRAGLGAALYLILHEGRPVAEARRQLSWRYGHWHRSRAGILDAFFEAYLEAEAATGIDFRTWVETVYDPDALAEKFRSDAASRFVFDTVLKRE